MCAYIYIYIYICIYIYIYIWGWSLHASPFLAYSMLKKVFSPAREYMFWITGALMQAKLPFRNMTWMLIVKLELSCRREHQAHIMLKMIKHVWKQEGDKEGTLSQAPAEQDSRDFFKRDKNGTRGGQEEDTRGSCYQKKLLTESCYKKKLMTKLL